MLHIIFLIILFLIILLTFKNSHKEYFYSEKKYESPTLVDSGFTKIKDLKRYTKKIEQQYNQEIPDLCKDKKIPAGWSCFKKDVNFTTDWKNDDKNRRFYLKHNYTHEESPPFKTENELNEEIIPNLPGLHPLVKHTFNLDSLYTLQQHPKRFIRLSEKSALALSTRLSIPLFEAKTQYVYDTKQKKIISNDCSEETDVNECRRKIDKENWENRTKKISWLKKSFRGDYDKDRVINTEAKVHSDSDYNKYISNQLNHIDKKNKKQIKYHLKLP